MSEFQFYLVLLVTAIIGAGSTYLLSTKTTWGVVRSSAFLSLVVGIIFYLLGEETPFFNDVPLVFIGASFVGMTSPSKLKLAGILFAGTLFGLLYIYIPSMYIGTGGTMGTAACVSVLCAYGISTFAENQPAKKRGSSEPLP